ncbi:unnamed protein product [Phytophthora fragariaefolia]|uniref:Unnamed protein product n=1 Tax=Phytophthora fragariaefolia TaxID=1490495 RepID=A0A9W6YCK8_9STRA|nr:unnamed protein product [Phytophthora fragariaefolia]
MNRKLTRSEQTWTTLKTALLRRYGERLDIAAAEWRVNQFQMMLGETYADFAARLSDATSRNPVAERVMLAQFCHCLNLTVKNAELRAAVGEGAQLPMNGTTGQTMLIPGVGGTGLSLDTTVTIQMATAGGDAGTFALFMNPQGVWNKFSDTWGVPKGRRWDGKLWAETTRKERKSSAEPEARSQWSSWLDRQEVQGDAVGSVLEQM